MQEDTGEMLDVYMFEEKKKMMSKEELEKWHPLPLPKQEVLEINGCSFVVKSYNTEKSEMVLRGISKEQAKFILMGGKLDFD